MSAKSRVFLSRFLISVSSFVIATQAFAAEPGFGPLKPKLIEPAHAVLPVAGPILDPEPMIYSKATLAALMAPAQAIAARDAKPVSLPPERMKELLTFKPKPNEMLSSLFGSMRPIAATPDPLPVEKVRDVEVATAR